MDILRLYFNDLQKFRATREENLELISKWKEGDMRAYDKLVRHFLPLVIKIAKKYGSSSSSLEDIIQEGNMNLLKGLEKFEESKGELAPYLVRWVEAGIIRFLKSDDIVRLPESQEYRKHNYFYLDQEVETDEYKFEIEDTHEEVDDEKLRIQSILINSWLDQFKPKDRLILEMFYLKEMERGEIAEALSLTRARVNQVIAKPSKRKDI